MKRIFDATPTSIALPSPVAIGSREHAKSAVKRNRNPIVKDLNERQPWMFYDRLSGAAGAMPLSLLFFTTPLSSSKTKLDTNLKQAGRLPDPKHFLCTAIRFFFAPSMTLADLHLIINGYYIEFEIGDKIYAEGHLDMYPAGGGLAGSVITTVAATTFSTWTNGNPSVQAINDWGVSNGITIEQGQTFQVRALAPAVVTAAAAYNIRCVLDGILYREVQ